MGKLKTGMIIAMKTRGYADKTIKLYTASVRAMAVYFNKTPLVVSKQEIEDYIYHLRTEKKSEATIRIYFEAIKFFFRLHGLSERLPKLRFTHRKTKLPIVLSQSETCALLGSCPSLKYKTALSVIYSAGLRVSEAANLRLQDIDFDRKLIIVRNGKNGKDRYTLLANETSALLRRYFGVYHPQEYVFYGKDVFSRISVDCIQRHFKKLIRDNGMDESLHVHTLRHCFATHLLENGTSIFHIMNLLGHTNIQTTMVYLHMESPENLHIQSPIDCFHFHSAKAANGAQQSLFKEIA